LLTDSDRLECGIEALALVSLASGHDGDERDALTVGHQVDFRSIPTS